MSAKQRTDAGTATADHGFRAGHESDLSAAQRQRAHTPQAEQAIGPLDTSDRPCQFERIPTVCLIADVCRILRIGESTFHRLMARKRLALVEIKIDRTRRFTGESVARVLRTLRTS